MTKGIIIQQNQPDRLKPQKGHGERKALTTVLRYLIPFVCSALLIIWLFKRIDFHGIRPKKADLIFLNTGRL